MPEYYSDMPKRCPECGAHGSEWYMQHYEGCLMVADNERGDNIVLEKKEDKTQKGCK